VATPLLAATAFLAAAPFPFLTAPAPFLAALASLAAPPFLLALVFLAALASLAAPPFLLAPPFLAALAFLLAPPFLAWPAWAPLRAFRARLDFEAVIRASPPVGSRLLYAVLCWHAGGMPATGTCRQSVPCRSRPPA
jgi:hypothetical protein